MARRREVPKRKILPDPKFGDRTVAKFTNAVMIGGKKSIAERTVYDAFDVIGKRGSGDEPVKIFKKALDNVKPMVEVKSRRVGGATYQIPLEITTSRQTALALRWLVSFSQGRKGVPMKDALATEIRDASEGQGSCIRKRDEMHKMAQANKAFSHFRW